MKLNNKFSLLTFIFCLSTITILSLVPPKSGVEMANNDKLYHFAAYAILSFNFCFILIQKLHFLVGIFLLIFYGILIEFFQGFVPGRNPSFYDALANSVGVLIGFLLFKLFSLNRIK